MNSLSPTADIHPSLHDNILAPLYGEVIACAACPRIVDFRTKIAAEKRKQFRDWNYWGKPVPGYGDTNGTLLIVGLAPAAHGGNRTARVFTGDKSADFLTKCLHHAGIANQPNSDAVDDGLLLKNAFMTPMLKCVPPGDKPTGEELRNCSGFFKREMEILKPKVILALGKIAFDGCLKYVRNDFDLKVKDHPFGHDKVYEMPSGFLLWGCYHPSPRNVNTGRMNFDMMTALLEKVKVTLKS